MIYDTVTSFCYTCPVAASNMFNKIFCFDVSGYLSLFSGNLT